MTEKQKRITRIIMLLLILIAAAVWKGQGFFSRWNGTVTQIVIPAESSTGYVMVRDSEGRFFRVDLPAAQLSMLKVGDHLTKERMTLVVKKVESEQ